MQELTDDEIKARLANDPMFAIDFAIDNQAAAISRKVEDITGKSITQSNDTLRGILTNWYEQGDQKFFDALAVPYNNDIGNYTGGYEGLFSGSGATQVTNQQGVTLAKATNTFWGSLLNGVAAFAGSFGSTLTGGGGNQADAIAYQAALAEQQRKKSQQTTIIIVVVMVVVAVGAFLILKNRKKK